MVSHPRGVYVCSCWPLMASDGEVSVKMTSLKGFSSMVEIKLQKLDESIKQFII